MRILTLIFLLCCSSVLLAQDQSLGPDGENDPTTVGQGNDTNCTVTFCDAADCHLDVDEDPASPTSTELVTETAADTIKFTFPTPSANVSTVTDDQNVDVNFTRASTACVEASGGTNPTYTLTLFCNGVSKLAIATNTAITGLDQRDASNTFTYTTDGDCDAAGANVEIQVTLNRAGGGGNRRHAALNTIQWEVTHAVAGRTRRFITKLEHQTGDHHASVP